MAEKLTQPRVDRVLQTEESGAILYDAECPGLRMVVGKRSASWRLAGTINDGSSTPVTLTLGRTDALTVKQARQEARGLKLRLSRGEDPRAERKSACPTVGEALDTYLASRGDLSPKTVDWYRKMVAGPLKGIARRRMDQVTRDDCRRLHERATRERGPYMSNSALRVLKLLYNDVARTVDLPPNPVSLAVRMNKERPREWALSDEEFRALWRSVDTMEERPVYRTAWLTLAMTGLRMNEVACLRRADIDWDEGVAHIRAPKGGEERAFARPLPRFLLQEFAALNDETAPLGSDWLFPARSRTGHIHGLRRGDGLPPPHALRHSWASRALDLGVEMSTVSLALNHAGSGTTTWRYVRRDRVQTPVREATERVAQHLLTLRG